jgi:hypothetical protein
MADEGQDFGYCEECGNFCEVAYVYPHVGLYCKLHAPLVMDKEAFDLIFDKAAVPGPVRHRRWESILGILFFSKKHHAQAAKELGVDNVLTKCEIEKGGP